MRRIFAAVLLAILVASPACKSKATRAYDRGVALFYEGKVVEAMREYEKGLALAPADPRLLYAMGWAMLSQGNRNEATLYFGRCLKSDDAYAGCHKGMANLYFELGVYEKAREELERALQLDPKNPAIYSNLGDVYRLQENWPEARETYEKGRALLPRYGDLENGLITVSMAEAKWDQAIEQAKEALKKPYRQKSLKAETFYLLASAYLERGADGDRSLAGQTLRQGLAAFPDDLQMIGVLKDLGT